MKKATFILLVVFGGACMVGPKYKRPKHDVAPAYVNKNDHISDTDSVLNLPWFKLFGDSVLVQLIDTALRTNLNLRIAMARIE
jgi:multidrug efflux system outer membrane protein